MKTLKKALSIILGLAIMLSCVAGMQVSVAAEGTVALSVGEATVADGVVTVPVVVDANAGFQSLAVTVSYDDAVLDLVSAEKNAKFGAADDVAAFGPYDANPFKMMWAYAYSTENVTATGTIATLTFNLVDADAEATDITLAVTEAWDVAGNEVAATTAEKETVDLVKEPEGPVVDSALVFSGASLGFGTSSLQINFRVANTVLALYDNMEVVIIPQKYDVDLNLVKTPVEVVVPKANLTAAGSKNMSYLFTDIELHEVGLNIDYMLRAYNDGKLVAVSETFTTSAATYLKDLFPKQTKQTFRTLITDTLLVGYEAVARMAINKPESDLAIDLAENGSIIEGFDISEATQTIESYNTIDTFNSYNDSYKTTTSTHQVRKSVAIGKVPYITYRIKDSKGDLDLSKFTFKVSYEGATTNYNETLTTANADISLISGWVNFKFYDISLSDGNKDIFVEAYYDGAKVFDTTYSVESYLGNMLTNEAMKDLAAACIKLGISYRADSGNK